MLKYVLMCFVGLLVMAGCQAQDSAAPAAAKKQWEAGKDYALISPPVPTNSDKVVVTEVFSYACPHCAHYQPYAEELKAKLPAGAQFELLPAVFQPAWEPFARAFYTAKSLGLVDKTDRKSTRLNSSHMSTSYAVLCFKKIILTLYVIA